MKLFCGLYWFLGTGFILWTVLSVLLYLFIYLFIDLFIYLFICLFIYLFIYLLVKSTASWGIEMNLLVFIREQWGCF